jgi:hypothetical protein
VFGCALIVIALGVTFNLIGGMYGVMVLAYGRRNPLRLTPTSREGELESRQRGDRIVTALLAFKDKNDHFPGDLTQLVPDYLAVIEQPVVGECRWQYSLDAKTGFKLLYWFGPLYEKEWNTGTPGQWHTDR